MRWLTNRDGVGVLNMEDVYTKTGQPVINVLCERHPNLMILGLDNGDWTLFEEYGECLNTVPVACSEKIMEEMAIEEHNTELANAIVNVAMRGRLGREI